MRANQQQSFSSCRCFVAICTISRGCADLTSAHIVNETPCVDAHVSSVVGVPWISALSEAENLCPGMRHSSAASWLRCGIPVQERALPITPGHHVPNAGNIEGETSAKAGHGGLFCVGLGIRTSKIGGNLGYCKLLSHQNLETHLYQDPAGYDTRPGSWIIWVSGPWVACIGLGAVATVSGILYDLIMHLLTTEICTLFRCTYRQRSTDSSP